MSLVERLAALERVVAEQADVIASHQARITENRGNSVEHASRVMR
jgi:uncharacterized coiled-coil protein SlyX